MGRLKELTEEERQELLAKGYRPVEIWVPDWSSPVFQKEVEEMGKSIRDADRREQMDKVLEAFIDEVWDDFR